MAAYQREEIVQMYKEAADKNKQIKILAQLNCCSEAEILNILAEAGVISGVSKKMTKGATPQAAEPTVPYTQESYSVKVSKGNKNKWTKESLEEVQRFIDEGLTYAEIGERMGTDKTGIQNAVNRHGLRGRSYKAEPKVSYSIEKEKKVICNAPKKSDEADKRIEELKRKLIHMQNELDDISEAAKVVKDLVMLPCMVSFEECESFEGMVQEILYRAGELLSEIIKRAEGETK